ncbi:MAG: TatD family hydrolase [Alphaproteobacteria bacterium]|nr:TatD family hydrolase [Alphaproteobacteria bacterium]
MLVDSHCHLDFPEFADELDQIVARAGAAGIGSLVTICTKVSEFGRVRAIAERYENVWCSVGIHPHEAGTEPALDAERLVALARHAKVVGIGETGLDYYYEHSPREAQARSFRAHLHAARETGLPAIVHTRDAEDDTIRILREEHARGAFPGVIHCFTSSRRLAEAALALGLLVSVSGIVTFRNADVLRETVRDIPLGSLLVETDAPYLAPVPRRGRRNEPAFVAHTAAFLAGLKGVSMAELAEATTDNFFRLFSKARKPVSFAA